MQPIHSRKEFVFEKNVPEITPREQGYVPVPSAIEESMKQRLTRDRVEWLGRVGEDREVYLIDGAVRAEVWGSRVREEMVRHWTDCDADAENKWKWSSGILAAGGVVLTVAAIGGVPSLVAASAAVVFGSLFATLYYYYHWSFSSSQLEKWSANPGQQIAMDRAQVYREGFLSLYHNPSLRRLVLQSEVEYLFQKYFEQKCEALARPNRKTFEQKKQWVQEFLTKNPISADVLRDVYGNIPEKYTGLSRQFEHFATSFAQVQSDCTKARGRVDREASQQIGQIAQKRKELMAPAQRELDRNRGALLRAREEKLKRGQDPMQVEKDYEEALRPCQATYEMMTAPIQTFFKEKLDEANRLLREKHKEINAIEKLAAQPYYEQGQKLLAAMIACQKFGTQYREPLFDPAELLRFPSYPSIRVEFRFV